MARITVDWDDKSNAQLPKIVIVKIPTLTKIGMILDKMPGMGKMLDKMKSWLPAVGYRLTD